MAAVPNLFGTRDRFYGWQLFHGGGEGAWFDGSGGNVSDRSGGNASDGSGGNASDGEWWGAADEASLARPPLTSCCAAWFLTGHGPGVGDPYDTKTDTEINGTG